MYKPIIRSATVVATIGVVAGQLMTGNAAALSTTSSKTNTTDQQTHLQTIISKGDAEIARRLTTLSTLATKINAATKLSASDKATLSTEVSSTTSGLNDLKVKLDAETTVDGAHTDAQDIFTEYRVYALVAPKVAHVKVADDQQMADDKLAALATKLQSRLDAAKQAGKDTSSLQAKLDDLNAKVAAARALSSSVESSIVNLQPTDYNSDHTIISGKRVQLQTAHSDKAAARADAQAIVSGLKSL